MTQYPQGPCPQAPFPTCSLCLSPKCTCSWCQRHAHPQVPQAGEVGSERYRPNRLSMHSSRTLSGIAVRASSSSGTRSCLHQSRWAVGTVQGALEPQCGRRRSSARSLLANTPAQNHDLRSGRIKVFECATASA